MDETKMTLTPRQTVGEAPGYQGVPGAGTDAGVGRLPPPGRGPWRWLALLVVIGLAYWGWRHYMQPAATNKTEATDAGSTGHGSGRGGRQPVGVATIAPRDIHVVIDALGTVTPLATVTVVSQISGYLQQVVFTEGQRVKKGDFLAQIDPRPYLALKAQYEGQLAHDQGLLAQAKVDDARYQNLLKQNSIARQTAEDQKYIVQQYVGTVAADQAQIDAQSLNITYCHIVSPVDGRVGLRQVDAGNFVQAGAASSATAIAVVTQLQPMSVIFSVPEDAIRKIAPKMRDGGTLAVTAYDRANVKKIATGATTVLDNQVDTTTGMVKLRAIFDNKDEVLFPNEFVNIRLLVDTLQGVAAAPTAGIQHGAPGDYAYIVGADDKASVRVVKLGQTDGDYVAITSGLAAGDRVVVDGADRLRDGASVRIVGGSGQPSSASAAATSATPAAPANGAPPPAAAPAVDPAAAADPAPGHHHHRRQQDGSAQEGAATSGASK